MAKYHFRGKALIDVEAIVESNSKQNAIHQVEQLGIVSLTPPSPRDPHDRPVFRPENGGSIMIAGSISKMWIVKKDEKAP